MRMPICSRNKRWRNQNSGPVTSLEILALPRLQSLTQLKWLSRKGVYVIIMELKSKRSNVLISKDCWCQSLWPLSLKHCFFGGRGAGGWHATDLSWYYLVSYHHPAIRPLTGSSRKESDKSDRYQLVPHVYNYFLSLRQRIFLMPCSSS